MRYAINVPNFGDYADPATFVRLAHEAETAGWDGFFVWDHILVERDWGVPLADPWILLSAAASVTSRIRLGPMVAPLPRRRPWVVARQAVTLDHLSEGRLVLGVGLGMPAEAEFAAFGEDPSPRVRADKLDEALAIVEGLGSGETFSHAGTHYQLEPMRFLPASRQRPRIPVWVAGWWPHRAAFQRAARWDGVFPASTVTEETGQPIPTDELNAILHTVRDARGERGLEGFDVMVGGGTPAEAALAEEVIGPYREAGVTWWSEGLNGWRGSLEEMEERLRAGPPRVLVG
jgi:alkanesulfonate monooxygenase SsuD/methylene tetrahydromethanopterin reductase-like flavin-dependent oxidoreductase (luciferase family)